MPWLGLIVVVPGDDEGVVVVVVVAVVELGKGMTMLRESPLVRSGVVM
jgi:hypothetical protein